MAALHETAYPRLKMDTTTKELAELYTPTETELAFATKIAKRQVAKTALLIHLKLFQRLGYFIKLGAVPEVIRDHIRKNVGFKRPTKLVELKHFEASPSRRTITTAIRQFLKVRTLDAEGNNWLEKVAMDAAETRQSLPDIINVLLEELAHHRYELPAFSTLDRLAIRVRERVNSGYFADLSSQLSPASKALIDELLKTKEDQSVSGWQMLKREPKRPTNKETRSFLQHIRRLQELVDQLPKPNIPVPKLKYYRSWARALDATEMAALQPQKRYALAVIYIRSQFASTLDNGADLFIRLMQNLENSAKQKLLEYQQEKAIRTDMLISQLRDILQAFDIDGTATQRIDAIGTTFVGPLEDLLEQCNAHLAYAGRNHLPFLLLPYRALRAQLLNSIEIIAPRSNTEDQIMERLIASLKQIRSGSNDIVLLEKIGLKLERDFSWMDTQWRKLVLMNTRGKGKANALNRKYFELAVLQQIKDELKSGDLYIQHGERYDDYREQLVDDSTFAQELEIYGSVTGIDTNGTTFVKNLKSEMADLANRIDSEFPTNIHAEIADGRLVLRKAPRQEVARSVLEIDAMITERMQAISIVDILIDTEKWLDLHHLFRPIAGTQSRLEDLRMRVISTLFCYGCNLGPVQTAKSIKGLSRRQASWLNMKYVTEDLLQKALVKVINAYNKYELPGYWGTGKSASADGTKWNLYEQNILSEHHIRYGGYGGIGYYHVSDKYIALFSHFISCGTYEGIHILDGLLENESEIQPDTLHGDTHAQSYPVFGLAHILGIKLMPRIRGVKDLVFWRADPRTTYTNIDAIFDETKLINWKLIETHLPDMLRVAISIKQGKISASAILRRLGTHSRKNKLYAAFRELGKVERTIFLLNYIGNIDLRKTIQSETNKSEQFNAFAKWSFFGGQGVIAENIGHEQQKVIKYNHLIANLIILHNVDGMTRILEELIREGVEITPEILAGIAPYRVAHINRFGDYVVDFGREVPNMAAKFSIIH